MWRSTQLQINIHFLVSLTLSMAVMQSDSIHTNHDTHITPNFEPICTEQHERFIESEGKESSLILELSSSRLKAMNSTALFCKKILTAPESYGFIVRLIRPKFRKSSFTRIPSEMEDNKEEKFKVESKNMVKKLIENGKENTTAFAGRSCPLSIFSSLDPFRASWLVDPCQLEDLPSDLEDPVRLFQGRLRIIWEHRHNVLDSKLMVTVVGKGVACQMPNRHSCLKIGLEPLLCISKDLACDGIRHCPYSNEYDSDEDYNMCWKRKKIDVNNESDIWEHWAIEIFRNLFAFDAPTMSTTMLSESNLSSSTMKSVSIAENTNSPTLTKVDNTHITANETLVEKKMNATIGGSNKRNSTRSGLNSDLSKYGPWGYLMLGMLLCGGALLICGLWASATQSGQNEGDSSVQQGNAAHGNSSTDHQSSLPPNYDELDPPPSYSVLFPNQKAMSNPVLSGQASIQPSSIVAASDLYVLAGDLPIITSSAESSVSDSRTITQQHQDASSTGNN